MVHTVLVQFVKIKVPVITMPHVNRIGQIEDILSQAQKTGGIIVHTLVDVNLRNRLIQLAKVRDVAEIDLMGPLLKWLIDILGQEPIGHPGLYRQLHLDYFKRVAAIEFTIAHDDGMNAQDWPMAEIILTGVSRAGKTPLSIYLSVLGWKVANVPIIMGLPVPQGLFELDHRRIIGLDIKPDTLVVYRRQREMRMGMHEPSSYADLSKITRETETALRVFRKGGFCVVDVTRKPIETSAHEVIELITGRFKEGSHLG